MTDTDNAGVSQFSDAPYEGQADEAITAPVDEVVEEESDTQAPDDSAKTGITFDELAQKKGFKSADDLARSYTELESKNKQVEMDRADLIKARGGQETIKPGTAQPTVEKEVRALKERVEINELFGKYSDAKDYAKSMAEHIKSHPNATWEQAYRYVKFDDLAKTAKQEGRKEAYDNIDQKKRSVAEKPSPRPTQKKDLDSMIKDRSTSLADIEKLLPRG